MAAIKLNNFTYSIAYHWFSVMGEIFLNDQGKDIFMERIMSPKTREMRF